MALTENLVSGAAMEVLGTTQVEYQGTPIDLTAPWRRVTMSDLVKEAMGGFDFDALDRSTPEKEAEALAAAKEAAAEAGVPNLEKAARVGNVLNECFEHLPHAALSRGQEAAPRMAGAYPGATTAHVRMRDPECGRYRCNRKPAHAPDGAWCRSWLLGCSPAHEGS